MHRNDGTRAKPPRVSTQSIQQHQYRVQVCPGVIVALGVNISLVSPISTILNGLATPTRTY